MTAFFQQQQATSKFSIAALLTSEPMLQSLRRELRKVSGNIKIENDQLVRILQNDVLKRETVDGDEAKQAQDFLKKSLKSAEKSKAKVTMKPAPSSLAAPSGDAAANINHSPDAMRPE